MIDEVKSKKAVAGLKRSMKLIESDNAEKAFVAGDIAPMITKQILDACKEHGVAIELVSSKHELGKACRLDVDASVAVLPKA
ncbi:MAG: ribosomal L7Ae/L30e/S12e/Gadd45 family protein [Clostridia bacterium]|nr:ribosomal L7Ae/L30e/S12e/Gadd45 family protein [Clostridia bacterium]